MLAYAANRPVAGKRQSSPHALLIVISAHVALVAVVMSAKMDLPARIQMPPIKTIDFPVPIDPPPQPQPNPHPVAHSEPAPKPLPPLPLPHGQGPIVTTGPIDNGAIAGVGSSIVSVGSNPIKLLPIHRDPRLLTPPSELKPPYPATKLASEEEATLTLRLTIDEQGRVVSVEPVGRADQIFVEAARRHLISHWRYVPATSDGRAITSTQTITLRFQLDG